MLGTKRNFISLDIGYSGIKAAVGSFQKKKFIVKQFIYEPFPISELETVDINYIEAKLKEFVVKNNLQGCCVFSLSDKSLAMHGFKLPKMPYDELSDAIKWEISRTLKIDPQDILYDFTICRNSPDGDKDCIYVMSAIASKEPYIRIANLLRENKLKLLGCDVSFLADVRFLDAMNAFQPGKAYVVINFGALFTSLSVVYDKCIVFNRRISLSGVILTKAIKDYCKLSMEEAEKYKVEYGLSADILSDKIIESVNIINSNCEKIISDIQYSLKYFSYQGTRSFITMFEKVFITGGGAGLKNFEEFIKERLNIEVQRISYPDNVLISNLKIPENLKNFDVFNYGTAVLGNLLWARKNVNWTSVNLLPGDLTEGGKKEFISYRTVLKRFFSLFGAALLLFSFLIALVLVERYQKAQMKSLRLVIQKEKDQKRRIERSNMDLLDLKAQKVKENEKMELEISLLKKKIEGLKKFHVFGTNPAYYITEILNSVPYPDIVLTVLSYEDDKIILRGEAVNNNKVSEFMKKINESNYFYNTSFDFMEKMNETSEKSNYPVNFKITVKVKK